MKSSCPILSVRARVEIGAVSLPTQTHTIITRSHMHTFATRATVSRAGFGWAPLFSFRRACKISLTVLPHLVDSIDDEDEVMALLAEQLNNLIEPMGGAAYAHLLLVGLAADV